MSQSVYTHADSRADNVQPERETQEQRNKVREHYEGLQRFQLLEILFAIAVAILAFYSKEDVDYKPNAQQKEEESLLVPPESEPERETEYYKFFIQLLLGNLIPSILFTSFMIRKMLTSMSLLRV